MSKLPNKRKEQLIPVPPCKSCTKPATIIVAGRGSYCQSCSPLCKCDQFVQNCICRKDDKPWGEAMMFHPMNGRKDFDCANPNNLSTRINDTKLALTSILGRVIYERYQELDGNVTKLKEEFELSDELLDMLDFLYK